MTSNGVRRIRLASIAIASVLFAGVVYAQDAPASQGQAPPGPGGTMMMQKEMMADMQAAQTRLDALVVSMNAATGAEKVDRLAAVVTEMVAQHKTMSQRMMSMQSGMMHEMMQGMHGASAPAPAPQNGSPEDHSAHHPPEK